MKKYKTRPGVYLETIRGNPVLISTTEAIEFCPYVTELNETSAFIWKQLSINSDINQLLAKLFEEYDTNNPAFIMSHVTKCIDQLADLNYLICAIDQENDNEE